jgi:hypothetical protein
MADDDDSAYFERRLNHCLKQANVADDPAVASVHRGFAIGYAKKLDVGNSSGLQRVRKSESSSGSEPSARWQVS